MPALRYVTCDVFTDTPLAGNQLAVFTDARALSDTLMQALALEVGYSETVFVVPPEQGGHARLRIFTPGFELPFAGHPVLGTAFVLGAPLQLGAIELETGRGTVSVLLQRDESGRIVFGRMRQPVPTVEPFAETEALFTALGVAGSIAPVELYDNGARHLLVTLPTAGAVESLAPDRAALAAPASAASRATGRAGRRACSGSAARTLRRARPPARSRATSPATTWSRGARRS